MRGRIPLGVTLVLALLLSLSSLGLYGPPKSILEQFASPTPAPPTDTPAATPAAPTSTPIPPTGVPPTDTPVATGVPPTSVPATPAASPPPKPRGEPPTPSRGIRVNGCARVIHPQGINLGQAPGFSAAHVQIVGQDDIVFVTQGPERADGLWWWKVTTRAGVVGWGIDDRLAPYTGVCAGSAPSPASASVAAASATPSGSQGKLPATGGGDGGWLIAGGGLVAVLLIAGLIRRRTQRTI
jgi:LPXTG-motif cell wall-anchored protein